MADKTTKISCECCGKLISKNNMAIHRRKCKHTLTKPQPTTEELLNLLKQKDIEITKQKYEIENLKLQVKNLNNELISNAKVVNNVKNVNNNFQINIDVNNYYVYDENGLRDGLDMTKVRSFGNENIEYIDPSKPLPTILKDMYCNKEHLENQVLSHQYLNMQWIIIKYEDHMLRLNLGIDNENINVITKLIVDNAQKLFNKEFPNVEERYDAIRQLLQNMEDDVEDMIKEVGNNEALKRLPVWNKEQYKSYEERDWMKYMDMKNYSQNLARIDTKKWDAYY